MQLLWCNTQNDRMISVHFQSKWFNTTVIQVYSPTTNAKEAEVEWFYDYLQDLVELTPQKRCFIHHSGLECKSRKSSKAGETGKFDLGVQTEAGQRLTAMSRECTGQSKHPLPTTQEKTLHMDITRWSTLKSDWLYSLQPKMEKLYTVSKNKTRSWLWLRSWTPYYQIQT